MIPLAFESGVLVPLRAGVEDCSREEDAGRIALVVVPLVVTLVVWKRGCKATPA